MILFSDPKKEYLFFKKKINSRIIKTLSNGVYTLGDQTNNFEKNFAKYIDAKYCTSVNSGTDALKISLLALGIGKGDEVITSSHTALATISAIIDVGATPVLLDIDKKTYNSLESYMLNVPEIDIELVCKWLEQICKILDILYEKIQFHHCDTKATQIFLDKSGNAILGDLDKVTFTLVIDKPYRIRLTHLPYTNFFGEVDHKIEPTFLNTLISQTFNKPELLEYTFVQGNIISKLFGWSLYFTTLLILTNLSALINKDFKNEAKDYLITSKTRKISILYFSSCSFVTTKL